MGIPKSFRLKFRYEKPIVEGYYWYRNLTTSPLRQTKPIIVYHKIPPSPLHAYLGDLAEWAGPIKCLNTTWP